MKLIILCLILSGCSTQKKKVAYNFEDEIQQEIEAFDHGIVTYKEKK